MEIVLFFRCLLLQLHPCTPRLIQKWEHMLLLCPPFYVFIIKCFHSAFFFTLLLCVFVEKIFFSLCLSPYMIIFVTSSALYTHWTPNHSIIQSFNHPISALRLGSLVSGILSSKSRSSQMSDSRQTPNSSIQSKSSTMGKMPYFAYPVIPVR